MILARVYLILFGFLFLDAFYRTTMFPQTVVVNQWIPTLTLLALIFLKLLLYGREKPLQSILIGVFALSFLVIYKITRDINLPIMAYLVIGAYGVSFRKIISVYTAIGIPLLLFCIVASQTGLAPDLVYDMTWADRGLRHSFGIIFPTDFAAHVTYLVLGWGYSDSAFMQKIDYLFSGRLYMGRLALDQYDVPLFGQEVIMQGAGYSETSPLGYYFYIDCSYIKMLVCYGLVVSIFIWMAYTLLGHRAVKAHDIYLIWVIGVIGLHCTMEHHLMEIAYNPFLLAAFAEWVLMPTKSENMIA